MIVKEQRKELVKRLLSDFHLNVMDRSGFKDQPLTTNEIEDLIESELKTTNIFPSKASKWTTGNHVFEGYFIEKLSDGKYKLHFQRHFATDPFQLAEKQEEIFISLDEITKEYLRREYNYNIDGLIVVEN